MKYLYFAYGSNLNVEVMNLRCPGAAELSAAVLPGWRLAERFYADVEPGEGSDCVNGALYAISADALESLDRCEGYPELYTRESLPVVDREGVRREALVYIMTEKYRRELGGRPFPAEYREICSAGAVHWGIPDFFASHCGADA